MVPSSVFSAALLSNWYVDAIHLLTTHTHDEGSTVTQQIKDQLSESDTYRYFAARNASNIADRFRNLFGLQMVLKQDLKDMHEAQEAAMKPLTELQASVADPSPSLVELAANCASCRGMQGRLCAHCKLDEKFTGWEVRLFSLKTTGMEAGKRVTAEEAARAAHQQTMLRRAGRGGLNEQAGPGQAPIPGARRTAAVAESTVVRHPSQVEQVLRMLMHQLRGVRVPPAVAAQRDVLLTAAKAHLELFEVFKREFLKGRALALEQRQKLYALDELEMCTMRIR